MVPMFAETAVDKKEGASLPESYSNVITGDAIAHTDSTEQFNKRYPAPSRFTNLKTTVSNAWNKTAGRGLNFAGTQVSNGVQSVKDAGNALCTGTQKEFGKATDTSVKTKVKSFATAANNDRKSSAIVTGVALAVGFIAYKTAQATAQAVQWLRVKRAKNVIAKIENVTDANRDAFTSAVTYLYNSGLSSNDITKLMIPNVSARINAQRLVGKLQEIPASKPSVTLVSRVKAAASKVWNKVPSFRKA